MVLSYLLKLQKKEKAKEKCGIVFNLCNRIDSSELSGVLVHQPLVLGEQTDMKGNIMNQMKIDTGGYEG